jgi:hypothetical protein
MALPFGNYTFSTFLYESFSYTITSPVGTNTLSISNSPGIPSGYLSNNTSNVVFSTSSNAMASGINQQFVITARDVGSNILGISSNNVTVGTGRFRDSNDNSFTGSNFTYYKNEPTSAVQFRAPFVISTPTTVPSLPPGLSFADVSTGGTWYNLAGTPLVTVPQSNYLVIGRGTGSNAGKIVTSTFGIAVSNERLRLDVSGSTIVSPMVVGTAITRRDVTARFPPYPTNDSLSYTWSGLPDGLVVRDIVSNIRYSPFTFSNSNLDPSYTLFISGAPTSNAAEEFRLAKISSKTITFLATRTNPLPAISNTVSFTFGFDETVLFTGSNVSRLYANNPLNPTANYFDAETAFGSTSTVVNIFSPNLRSDLSINFVAGQNRGYLTGTPTSASTNTFTIRAVNANSITSDLSQIIEVVNDTISFTSPLDTCYNFVLSRPLSNALTGYYPANIQFLASSASGNALTFTSTDLSGTGITLSNITNGVQLVGTPLSTLALQNVRMTATASNTGAVNYRDVLVEISDDVITLSNVPASNLAFVQNRPITPIQLRGTTLSGRPITLFRTPPGDPMPPNLTLGATGSITGVPTDSSGGSFSIIAYTDYTSNTGFTYSYTVTPDTMIFPLPQTVYTYAAGSPVSINIDALAYSGKTASNYAFSGLDPTYGLSIGSNTGIISGTLSTGVAPDDTLPSESNFAINATAGLLDGSLGVTMTTSNRPFQRFYGMQYVGSNISTWGGFLYYADGSSSLTLPASGFSSVPGLGQFPAFASDLAFKNNDLTGNTILIPVTGLTSVIGPRPYGDVLRSVGGSSFGSTLFASGISNARPYKAIYDSNTATWYMGGTITGSNGNTALSLFQSTDDGVLFSNVSIGGIGVAPRRNDLTTSGGRYTNYHTAYGTAFGYSNGVFLLGGTYDASLGPSASRMKRSTDGTTWTDVSGIFEVEVGNISTDGPVWVATGSSLYEAGMPSDVPEDAVTLKYSTDQGRTWSNATGTTHTMLGFDVVYASNVWLSSGISQTDTTVLTTTMVSSTDGINWSNVPLTAFTASDLSYRLPELASIFFDAYYRQWYAYVKFYGVNAYLYSHPSTGDMTTGWTVVSLESLGAGDSTNPARIFGQRFLANGPTSVTLSFATASGTGPQFTSPASSAITLYQYVTIEPITVAATGRGTVYFFVVAEELPIGILFDPVTGIFSGVSPNVGTRVVNVYSKDDNGISVFPITFTTIQAFVIKKQSGAGAWTALVRQSATVAGAQNSVNGRVLPAQQVALGEFTRDEPSDSVSAPGDPNCEKKC